MQGASIPNKIRRNLHKNVTNVADQDNQQPQIISGEGNAAQANLGQINNKNRKLKMLGQKTQNHQLSSVQVDERNY